MIKNETIILKTANAGPIELDYAELRKAVLVLRAVNHELRQAIIDLLEEKTRMTVTDIYIKLRLEQSVVSQHLAIMRRQGVVVYKREGKFVYYSLDNERLLAISTFVDNFFESELPSAKIDYAKLRKAALFLRAIHHKLRHSIIDLLQENGRLIVNRIYNKLALEQSITSTHLAILRRAGIVLDKKAGRHVYYTLDKVKLQTILTVVKEFVDLEKQ